MKEKTYKCRWSKCPYESKDIAPEDDFQDSKGNHYHKECYEKKEALAEINSVWQKQIDPHPIYAQIGKVKNEICSRGVDPRFLLFAVKEGAKRKTLKYPGGMYYIVKDESLYKKWLKSREPVKIEAPKEIEVSYERDMSFQYNPKTTGLAQLFKKG